LFASHVVYGLRLRSNVALPGLSAALPSRTYDVQVHLKDWTSFPTTFPESVEVLYASSEDATCEESNLRVAVLPSGNHFGFYYLDGVRFAVDRQGREIWGDWPENYTLEDACTYLIGPVMGFSLRLRGLTSLHASAVAIDNRAIALVGLPSAGKSTTAAAFAQHGFPVIADDVVVLTEEEGKFLVPPGYPRVNLWPDSVQALLGSQEALPQVTPNWEKRYMKLDIGGLSFASKFLPLGAIYLLDTREQKLAAPVFEAVTGGDAVAALVVNSYVNYLLDHNMRSKEFDVLSRVVSRIPIRRVRPKADPAAVFDLCKAIVRDARHEMTPIPLSRTSRPKSPHV